MALEFAAVPEAEAEMGQRRENLYGICFVASGKYQQG